MVLLCRGLGLGRVMGFDGLVLCGFSMVWMCAGLSVNLGMKSSATF